MLSTFLAVREFRKDRRRVQVRWDMEYRAGGPNIEALKIATSLAFISVKAINVGHRPIEIAKAGLRMTNGHEFTETTENPLPKKLEDGESVSIIFDCKTAQEDLEDWRKKGTYPYKPTFYTKVFVKDAQGHIYTSRFPRNIIR